jgi:hypothetical protein
VLSLNLTVGPLSSMSIHGNEVLVMMEKKRKDFIMQLFFLKERLSVKYQVLVVYRFLTPAMCLLVLLFNVTMHTVY